MYLLYLLVNIDPKYTNLLSKGLYVYVHTGAVEFHAFRRLSWSKQDGQDWSFSPDGWGRVAFWTSWVYVALKNGEREKKIELLQKLKPVLVWHSIQ